MTFVTVRCPPCDSEQLVKRGKTRRGTRRSLCQNTAGSVAKFDFGGKIQKSGVRNSMTYRLPNSRKSNFATEPFFLPL
jgi:hypothetical protein